MKKVLIKQTPFDPHKFLYGRNTILDEISKKKRLSMLQFKSSEFNIFIYYLAKYAKWDYVKNPSVSLSFILSRNEKVEWHIRKNTYKLIVLRFGLKVASSFLYGFALSLLVLKMPSLKRNCTNVEGTHLNRRLLKIQVWVWVSQSPFS